MVCSPFSVRTAYAQAGCFTQTGQCISDRFRAYWETHGGLSMFGLPISGELWEDGRLVQYFERNRFEFHPENAPPYDVLIGRFGAERLAASGRNQWTMPHGAAQNGCLFFNETRHSLCGAFRAYWEQRGGLAIFGFPITEPFSEMNEADGKVYTVQYFERNRFEFHPENPAPYNVLLGLLGAWRANWLLSNTDRQPHPTRAAISGPEGTQGPLADVTLQISAPGYSGPAELRVFDGSGWLESSRPLTIRDGAAAATFTSGGALGTHSAVLVIGGKLAGATSQAYTLDAQTSITTGQPSYDELVPLAHQWLSHDISEYTISGLDVRGYRSPDSDLLWLRDHVYQALGYRYFEPDMTSLLDYFRHAQHIDGSFDDYVANPPWGLIKGRTEVEADLEYLFVQGVYQAWQATGDDGWLQSNQDAMQRGLNYTMTSPIRWEPSLGLVKRPYTIDTWDFEYGGPTTDPNGNPSPRHWIDSKTKWSIMHGDNTGLAYAMTLMAKIAEQRGDWNVANDWRNRATALMNRLNAVSWNGNFFAHQVNLTPVPIPGLDAARQLSLSNAYALNRDVLSDGQAVAILNEYQRRMQQHNAFAEWYSIDPPFPAGSFGTPPGWGNQPGEYVNGGIMPLVGGELARGAFRYGQENYGFSILNRYHFLVQSQGGSYLWYYPAGNPGKSSDNTLNTDGWGSSAMLVALIEGAAGVVDNGALYKDVTLSPRWAADSSVSTATVVVRYPASYGYVAYRWERQSDGIALRVTGSAERGTVRVLLPEAVTGNVAASINGMPVAAQVATVGTSRYVELPLPRTTDAVQVTWGK
ncbi:MAG TPA: hypothetical protein VFT66_26595 [Roseiflexaceae bacterium]|nr:hypothetical protein [Roseiflexaceae bacterium]